MTTCGLYYSAAGHWTLSALAAGFDVKWHDALDDKANAVLLDNFPNIPFEHRPVDILMGSPPCSGFSPTIGYYYKNREIPPGALKARKGVLRFARLVNDLGVKQFVMEMVPSFRKFDEYREFKHTLVDWHIQEIEIDTANFGACQKRKRIYFVGSREEQDGILLSPTGYTNPVEVLLAVADPGYQYRYPPPPGMHGPYDAYIRPGELEKRRVTSEKPTPTIVKEYYRYTMHPIEERFLGMRETAALMGFEVETWKLPYDKMACKAFIGPGVDIRATTEILKQIFFNNM